MLKCNSLHIELNLNSKKFCTIQEFYYCPGYEDSEDKSACCNGGCCSPSNSNTTGIIITAILSVVNIVLVSIVIYLHWDNIKNVSLTKQTKLLPKVKYNKA